MKTVFTELVYAMEKGTDTVLVTIVEENGSVPRGRGTMMLVGTQGRLAGTAGGGSVEISAIKTGKELICKKECLLHDFILRPNGTEDIGMVCGGDVTLWFQYIAHDDAHWQALASEILKCMEGHREGWLVFDLKSGNAQLLYPDMGNSPEAEKNICAYETAERTNQKEIALAPENDLRVDEHTGKRVGDFFSVPLPLGERVIVFGAGHIARALVPIIAGVGFRPVVFDNNEVYANAEVFPEAEQIIIGDFDKIADYIDIQPDDYIVIMTSGHSHDFVIQEQVLRMPTAYVGVIGSRRKTASVNARLMEAGIGEEVTKQVHTPIGTAIKAVTPAEIAVSIAGELIYVRAMLREGAHQKSGSLEFEGGEEMKKHCPMH